MHHHHKLDRRHLLRVGAAAAASVGVASFIGSDSNADSAASPSSGAPDPVPPEERKLLFVFCAYGGASIIDSFLPIAESEVGDPELAATLNVFPDDLIEHPSGSNIRFVKLLPGYSFYSTPPEMGSLVTRHGGDMVVIPHNVSSVNHTIGQQRSLNGAGIQRGRTIMEAMALRYGAGLPLPSCNMAIDGYARHGTDLTIPQEARHEIIAAPRMFASGTHGYRGLAGVPPEAGILAARKVRNKLDQRSLFGLTFKESPELNRYLRARDGTALSMEQADMIDKLLLLDTAELDEKYGVQPSELVTSLRERFPHLDEDNTQAQVALGFLMAYYGMSTSITLGHKPDPVVLGDGSIVGTPIAFDFSHNLHRIVQSIMWGRTANLLDQLIDLLKTHDYMGDPALGKMWDRSLIYVATEFGRDKIRNSGASQWGTSHHMNNGALLISPLLKGNKVYGGVDPTTALTYGFDPQTGEADRSRELYEGDIYSIIAHALDINFPERVDFPSVVRG
jgi:hypothetical protein